MSSAFETMWNATAGPAFQAVFGGVVTIRRGTVSTTGVTAQKFLGERTMETGDGGTLKFYGAAWVIAKSEYAFSGTASEPRNGDRIIDGGEIWEVTPIEGIAEVSEQPGAEEWLIMTKRIRG